MKRLSLAVTLAGALALGAPATAAFAADLPGVEAARRHVVIKRERRTVIRCVKLGGARGCPVRRYVRRSLAWPGAIVFLGVPRIPPGCGFPFEGVCDPTYYTTPYWTVSSPHVDYGWGVY